MRPELFNHWFHENVKSGLHITQLKIGQTYDSIHYANGHWQKERWERTEVSRKKQVIDKNTGQQKDIIEWIPSFYHKDETVQVEAHLQEMDAAIDAILANLSTDFYEMAMIFEAAYRNHQLGKFRPDIEEFKSQMHRAIGNDFNLDDNLTIFRIVCSEVWATHQNEQDHYLQLVLE